MRTYALADTKLYDEVVQDYGSVFPGIYRLHFQRAAGEFDSIPRFFGSDELGLLYLGASLNVPRLISNVIKSVSATY